MEKKDTWSESMHKRNLRITWTHMPYTTNQAITSQKSSVSLNEFSFTSKSSFYRPIYLPAGNEQVKYKLLGTKDKKSFWVIPVRQSSANHSSAVPSKNSIL